MKRWALIFRVFVAEYMGLHPESSKRGIYGADHEELVSLSSLRGGLVPRLMALISSSYRYHPALPPVFISWDVCCDLYMAIFNPCMLQFHLSPGLRQVATAGVDHAEQTKIWPFYTNAFNSTNSLPRPV